MEGFARPFLPLRIAAFCLDGGACLTLIAEEYLIIAKASTAIDEVPPCKQISRLRKMSWVMDER